jgi:hypothetical protein
LAKGQHIFHMKWIKWTTYQNLAYNSPSMKPVIQHDLLGKWVLIHITRRCVLHLIKNLYQ